MITFGFVWETNLLVYLPDNILPEGFFFKIPFKNDNNNFTQSLEFWNIKDRKVSDCLTNLEFQLGPFEEQKDFSDVCIQFGVRILKETAVCYSYRSKRYAFQI